MKSHKLNHNSNLYWSVHKFFNWNKISLIKHKCVSSHLIYFRLCNITQNWRHLLKKKIIIFWDNKQQRLLFTCVISSSSKKITDKFQLITSENGSIQALLSITGMQPTCKASKNLYVANLRPLGIKQNVELNNMSL